MYITGTVIHGLENGRKFGFPTANVQPDTPAELEKGVYAVWVKIDGNRYKGMLYVGTRPTLGLHETTYEINIFNFRKSLYGKTISFRVIQKIRGEKRFKNTDELMAALRHDKETVSELLKAPTHAIARKQDIPDIMTIIGQAKQRMKKQGLDQWQDGYPNEEAILNDYARKVGHLFRKDNKPVAYAAMVFDQDPYYEKIDGQWLSNGETYLTVHRIAVHDDWLGFGFAQHILQYAERIAARKGVKWFRIDTHHDNRAMRNLIRDFGFTLCGIVQVRDGMRMAYEKQILTK